MRLVSIGDISFTRHFQANGVASETIILSTFRENPAIHISANWRKPTVPCSGRLLKSGLARIFTIDQTSAAESAVVFAVVF